MAADADAHKMAVQTNLGQADGPHIFVADVDYAMQFAALPGTATIEEIGITINEDDYFDYVLDLMRREDGAIMGLTHQATPGAMIYRADIAAEVFGIESEAEMQALVSDWAGFVEAAREITQHPFEDDDEEEDENNTWAMIYGADELKRNFLNNRNEGWVVPDVDEEGNPISVFNVCEATITEFVEVTRAIQEMGGLNNNGNGQWASDGWWGGMGDGVFAYFGSTWYLHFIIADTAETAGSFGKWGIIPGPAPFYWGGTYWFACKEAVQDDEMADAIRQIIEFFCVDDESIEIFVRETGDFTSKRSIVERIKDDPAFENPFFLYNTNHYQVFAEIADTIDITRNITRYDADMDTLFADFIANIFVEDMTINAAMELMRDGVRGSLSTITVP
jgi:hypothetical protein